MAPGVARKRMGRFWDLIVGVEVKEDVSFGSCVQSHNQFVGARIDIYPQIINWQGILDSRAEGIERSSNTYWPWPRLILVIGSHESNLGHQSLQFLPPEKFGASTMLIDL